MQTSCSIRAGLLKCKLSVCRYFVSWYCNAKWERHIAVHMAEGLPFFANNLSNIIKLCMGNPQIANKVVRFPVEPQDSYRYREYTVYCEVVLYLNYKNQQGSVSLSQMKRRSSVCSTYDSHRKWRIHLCAWLCIYLPHTRNRNCHSLSVLSKGVVMYIVYGTMMTELWQCKC